MCLVMILIHCVKCRGLEKALDRMRAAWDGLEFRVLDFKDTGTCILGGIDDVQASVFSLLPKQAGRPC